MEAGKGPKVVKGALPMNEGTKTSNLQDKGYLQGGPRSGDIKGGQTPRFFVENRMV